MIVIVIWPVFQALKESYFGSSIGGIRTGANGKPRLDKRRSGSDDFVLLWVRDALIVKIINRASIFWRPISDRERFTTASRCDRNVEVDFRIGPFARAAACVQSSDHVVIHTWLKMIGRSINYEPYRMSLVPKYRKFDIRKSNLLHQ
jgi:hypothetical protein